MLFKFIWKFKYHLGVFCLLLFGFSLYQLTNANIYFDSERIINELEGSANVDLKIVDDNNLIFLGITFSDSLDYQDFSDINSFHKELKKSDYVNRVFSIINDKKIINMGLFPMAKKTMDLSSNETYVTSLASLGSANNFITADTKNLLFLIEASPSLSNQQTKEFINQLYDTKINDKSANVSIAGRAPSELYFEKKVIREFVIITIISSVLCFLFLLLLTNNLPLVLFTVSSVVASIVVTLGISQIIFGGIELVMIITPAILFIVCISDIMHLSNKQQTNKENNFSFFDLRMNLVGKARKLDGQHPRPIGHKGYYKRNVKLR